MFSHDVNENYVKKDNWIKDLKKSFDPEVLSKLLKKRIDQPNIVGPYINFHKDEEPFDVIDALIDSSQAFREKIEPAIGLLLWKIMNGKEKEDHDLLRQIFSVIKHSQLKGCSILLNKWITDKFDLMLKTNDGKWKRTYCEALLAFARIQNRDIKMELWWQSIWHNDLPYLWEASFWGLRRQNPSAAILEIPRLLSRKINNTPYILASMWNDTEIKSALASKLKNGLKETPAWKAGLAINSLCAKLSDEQRNELMVNLKG